MKTRIIAGLLLTFGLCLPWLVASPGAAENPEPLFAEPSSLGAPQADQSTALFPQCSDAEDCYMYCQDYSNYDCINPGICWCY